MMTLTGGAVVPGRAGVTAEVTGEDCNSDPETEVGVRVPSSSKRVQQSETLTKLRLIVNLDNNKPNAISEY